MTSDVLARLARTVPVNSVGWFDLLDKDGSISRWLQSEDVKQIDYAVWLLGQNAILRERAARAADVMREALDRAQSAPAKDRVDHLLRLFDFADFTKARPVFDLYLDLLKRGELKERRRSSFQFHDLPKKNAAAAMDLLVAALDHSVMGELQKSDVDIDQAFSRIHLPEGFIHQASVAATEQFVKSILPRVLLLITHTEYIDDDGEVSDRTWPWLTLAFVHDHKASLLEALGEAMAKLAKVAPATLDELTRKAEELPHKNVAYLLLAAWSGNSDQYADKIINYLLSDSHRLNLGYGMWSTGNGVAAVTRGAITAASTRCSEDRLRRLEEVILGFFPPIEREDPKRLGYTQSLLLHAIDQSRIGDVARKRMQELERKFPGINLDLPGASTGAFVVQSPIPAEATQKMNDEQWILAMREYSTYPSRKRFSEDFRRGGASELSHQLETETRLHKERFARLVVKLGPDIPTVYFDAIIRGLVATASDAGAVADKSQEPLPELSLDLLLAALRHVHELPAHPCGRWLSSSIGKIARQPLPHDILDIISFYAINGEQPTDAGEGEKEYFGGDLVTRGINTTRGAAADAVGDLLFADPNRWPSLEQAVRALVADRSWSVRAVAISCLTALLNVDRDLAIQLFLEIAKQSPAVLGSLFVERFMFYAVFSHYAQMRETMLRMLKDSDQAAREASARAITVASFRSPEAETDVESVQAGDDICRAALATIAVGNLQFAEYSDRCRAWLIRAFNDESRKVHEAAARCFHEISDEQLSREPDLINAFLESPAFRDNAHGLLLVLEESVHRLPDVVCKIPERAVAIHRHETSDEAMEARWWTHQMATLVLRLYEQTSDPTIRTRCLDVLDDMIELDFGNIATELQKLERA